MAKANPNTRRLVDLLAGLRQPLYAVDGTGRIAFVNEALAHWAGTTIDELVGLRCRYHSEASSTPADLVAATLCPPPQVFAGEAVETTIHLRGAEGTAVAARARFLPLATQEEASWLVLAMLDDADVSIQPAEDAHRLHALLQEFRARQFGNSRFSRLAGTSPAIKQARERLELAAQNTVNVLLVAPPGGQANLTARELHHAQASGGALLILDAPRADAELIRDLHTRDSVVPKSGEPNLPTLLCFDADRLSGEAQLELENWLRARGTSVRVISTAQSALERLAAEQNFRLELACLLSTITVEVAPLADRAEDLPLLAQALLEGRNAAGEKQLGGFSPEALDALSQHSWPGDVQELAEVVREAHARATGSLVAVGEFPARLLAQQRAGDSSPRSTPDIDLDEFLADIETEMLRRALALSKGNKTKAAKMLGMTRPRLYRRLVQRGLEQPPAAGEIEELDWLDESSQ